MCIHLSCHWKGIDIPRSSDGKNWWEYIDPTINKEKLDGEGGRTEGEGGQRVYNKYAGYLPIGVCVCARACVRVCMGVGGCGCGCVCVHIM